MQAAFSQLKMQRKKICGQTVEKHNKQNIKWEFCM